MSRVLLCPFSSHACGCGAAMVSVGDVESIHLLGKELADTLYQGIIRNHPQLVAEPVLIGETVLGRALDRPVYDVLQLTLVLEGEEHGLDVRALNPDMDHAVILLVLAGELVLLDTPLDIVLRVGAKHEAVLGAAAHGLGIDVVARLLVPYEPSPLLPEAEVLHRPVIDLGRVLVRHRIEIDFRLGDMKQ